MKTLYEEIKSRVENAKEECETLYLPKNIAEYARRFMTKTQIDISSGDAINGYGNIRIYDFSVLRYYERCEKCKYHSLWRPNEGRCERHLYSRGLATVFSYQSRFLPIDFAKLEAAFDDWLKLQPVEGAELGMYEQKNFEKERKEV